MPQTYLLPRPQLCWAPQPHLSHPSVHQVPPERLGATPASPHSRDLQLWASAGNSGLGRSGSRLNALTQRASGTAAHYSPGQQEAPTAPPKHRACSPPPQSPEPAQPLPEKETEDTRDLRWHTGSLQQNQFLAGTLFNYKLSLLFDCYPFWDLSDLLTKTTLSPLIRGRGEKPTTGSQNEIKNEFTARRTNAISYISIQKAHRSYC